MINKVYLLWHAYITKELLVIASLTKTDNSKYIFKYEKDALKAKKLNCFLPFNYTEEELYFNSLPDFFSQRMLTSKYYVDKLGINYDSNDELSILTYGDSIKNTDNFRIISEKDYNSLMELTGYNMDDNNEKSYQPLRK